MYVPNVPPKSIFDVRPKSIFDVRPKIPYCMPYLDVPEYIEDGGDRKLNVYGISSKR